MVNNTEKQPEITYLDLEHLQYDRDTLMFLRRKLDDFTISCFRKVIAARKDGGLYKTKMDNYSDHRKRYDAALLILEAQGFIESRSDIGNSKPYFLTIRGRQLAKLLAEEKQNTNLNEGL